MTRIGSQKKKKKRTGLVAEVIILVWIPVCLNVRWTSAGWNEHWQSLYEDAENKLDNAIRCIKN
jgi:hypothetical protein